MDKKEITIGIDIGGTNTVIGFVDCTGNCLDEMSFPTHSKVSHFTSFLVKKIEEKISDKYVCRGIGIAAPHVNFLNGTIEAPANLHWGEVNLVELLQGNYDCPIAIINDANAAALGEMGYGKAKNMKNFIMITLGTGLGSGIVINGEILNGANGLAGELGHTTAVPDGRQCGCGKLGCLETYVAANGIRRTTFELLDTQNYESELYEVDREKLTAKEVSESATRKDPLALAVFEYTGKIFGQKLADVVACLDPEAIILFGGVVNSGDLLMRPTRHHLEANLLNTYKGKVALLKSMVQNGRSAVLGASLHVTKMLEAISSEHLENSR